MSLEPTPVSKLVRKLVTLSDFQSLVATPLPTTSALLPTTSALPLQGHSCKIGNMRPPGTLENQNPQFEKIFKFGLLFM